MKKLTYEIKYTNITKGDPGKPTIWFLKGLPASGKSTWAKSHMEAYPNCIKISKDDYRPLFGEYSQEKEVLVRAATRAAGFQALESGFDIIVDDTNLVVKYLNHWKMLAEGHDFNMVEIFFDTPIDICIERDLERPDGKKVGADRITEMYTKYMDGGIKNSIIQYREQDPALQKAIIVDIDGTLAMMNRGAFDETKFTEDLPNVPVINAIKMYNDAGCQVIVVSGRQSTSLGVTNTGIWLLKNMPCPFNILMRAEGDTRKDSVVKREIFDKYIDKSFNIQVVFDDRDQVVDMWRNELHLPCFQVNYGNF